MRGMRADFDLLEDGTVKRAGHGGARPGTGPKPAGYEKPESVQDYDKARARKEAALADLHELDYKVKSGEYVSRSAVKQASATVLSTISQTLRSVSDNLERRGVPTAVCVTVEAVLTEALADAGRDLEMMSGSDS